MRAIAKKPIKNRLKSVHINNYINTNKQVI